jgi:hypothetical protein
VLPEPSPLLDFAEAMGDMMFWIIAFALRTRELLATLALLLERLRGGLLGEKDWITQLIAKLTDFKNKAFAAESIPVLRLLSLEAAEAMINGVVPLFRDLPTDEKRGALFGADGSDCGKAETAEVVGLLRGTARGHEWGPHGALPSGGGAGTAPV